VSETNKYVCMYIVPLVSDFLKLLVIVQCAVFSDICELELCDSSIFHFIVFCFVLLLLLSSDTSGTFRADVGIGSSAGCY